jgi:hypothetical protein
MLGLKEWQPFGNFWQPISGFFRLCTHDAEIGPTDKGARLVRLHALPACSGGAMDNPRALSLANRTKRLVNF